MKPASVGFQCPDCVKQGAASVRQPTGAYGGRATSTPVMTYGLIALNALMFVLSEGYKLSFSGGSQSSLFRKLALIPTTSLGGQHLLPGDGVAQGAYYRLLTSTFLHFGIIHIAFNMFALYQLGPYVEQALGRVRFVVLYLLAGLGGAALSYSAGPVFETAAGASGAVFGLFGAFYVLQRKRGLDVGPILGTIGINLVLSFTITGIDWRGHVGGLVAGSLVTAALVYAPKDRRMIAQIGGAVGVAIIIVAMVAIRTHEIRSGSVTIPTG